MELLSYLELFSRTFENRFVFNLFNLLLCGVITLVIIRRWRAQTRILAIRKQLFLFLTFFSLGASFALGAIFSGAFLFLRIYLPESAFDLSVHVLWAIAWILLGASVYDGTVNNQAKTEPSRNRLSRSSLIISLSLVIAVLLLILILFYLAEPLVRLYPKANMALDLTNSILLGWTLFLFCRHSLGGRKLATVALALLLVAALFHLVSYQVVDAKLSDIFWNLEQFIGSLSLFIFALAVGETAQDLFDKVFVRLQVAFILLASLMILVITQTEKSEYMAILRSRSEQLAEFVRAQVDYFRHRNEPLSQIIERVDFLRYIVIEFGNQPELRIIRIFADNQIASFEINDSGEIAANVERLPPDLSSLRLNPEEYFQLDSLPLILAGPGQVELYGTRAFLDKHIRKRVITIFSLFTGMVAFSTLLIGLVVRGAGATIRRQKGEIEKTQDELIQASKLAAIGQLSAGVAHEINNPATTILSRATFLLMRHRDDLSASDREDLDAIVAQSQRISQITKGLLSFSRPQVVNIEPIDIDRVIEASHRVLQEDFAANHISIEKYIQPNLPRVMADEDSLVRVFENLFRNGIDAMPNGGAMRISATTEGSRGRSVRIEFSDTGVGISSENLSRIFDPFFTTKRVGDGTGLGLSIVHGIINEIRGSITVESQPDAGTTFVIDLPTEERR